MQEPPDSPHPHSLMTSDEVDWLVYSYLQESGELHSSQDCPNGLLGGGGRRPLCLCSRMNGAEPFAEHSHQSVGEQGVLEDSQRQFRAAATRQGFSGASTDGRSYADSPRIRRLHAHVVFTPARELTGWPVDIIKSSQRSQTAEQRRLRHSRPSRSPRAHPTEGPIVSRSRSTLPRSEFSVLIGL